MIYPVVSLKALQIFDCSREVEGKSYLNTPNLYSGLAFRFSYFFSRVVECFTDEYNRWIIWAWVTLFYFMNFNYYYKKMYKDYINVVYDVRLFNSMEVDFRAANISSLFASSLHQSSKESFSINCAIISFAICAWFFFIAIRLCYL